MTAKICFKMGKYLATPEYKKGIIEIMKGVNGIERVDLTLLISDHLGVKKDGISVDEAEQEIIRFCETADNMEDELKQFVKDAYLENN